ncbi:MAG: rhodanese-like domain-containing protein [Gemmatimonadetes bacterium]|nr:rhodanese-like domain-containing protein [Gemmatimonadota bacterium]
MKRIVGRALLVVAIGVSSGALHSLAVDDVQRPEKVSKDTALVVYCSGTTCNLGSKLAQKLAEEMDFTRIYVFAGGFPQWEEAGYPVESEGPF